MTSKSCPRCGASIDPSTAPRGAAVSCPTCGAALPPVRGGLRVLHVIVGLAALLFCCPLVGIGAAVIIPNILRAQHATYAQDCRRNLRDWYISQKAYYEIRNAYSPDFANVLFEPEPDSRYAYFTRLESREARDTPDPLLRRNAVIIRATTTGAPSPHKPVSTEQLPPRLKPILGLSGTCPACEITAACAANLDEDDGLDVWVISTGELNLRDIDGKPTAPGEPIHVMSDLGN
ncbi:hypothetical protein [Myxococcus sp. AB025B]|uniref:hypothetical protein n=1 Tax=Myxococcus sp. AB025B TaxID=2562794 RepID=UPI00114443F3|nr:hypothetical protein [Myxococcus sp. AB025B]